jgi:hypothetical protein
MRTPQKEHRKGGHFSRAEDSGKETGVLTPAVNNCEFHWNPGKPRIGQPASSGAATPRQTILAPAMI